MRFIATITSIFLSLGTIGCQSFGSAEYIPDATPVPYQISLPTQKTLPANFPTRPCVKPASPPQTPRCSAACVMDALTGKILYSHNGKRKLQVASTQKLVTALIIAEQGNLNKKITIQNSDTKADPTKLGFRAGEVYSRGSLLNALMVKSYNDVALALARDCAGSVPRFVRMMNKQARQMYMKNSRFANPNGLPADQYSTAEDMAKCGYFVYRNPILRSIICQKSSTFKKHNGKIITMNNTNKLLARHSWITGMKTGYTRAAGRCLVSSGGFNGRHVIVVVLGCHPSRIWNESEKLLKWGLLGS